MYAGEAWHVIVGGTGAFGGGSRLGRTDHGDELLDVVLVERGSRLGLVLRAWGMRRGTLEEQRGVLHRRVRHAEIGVAAGTEFNVDGEICELRRPPSRAPRRRAGGGAAMNGAGRRRSPSAGAAWYASESLRHRREQGDGYTLDGEALEVGTPEFLRACEELTAAAATEGSHAEVLVNGDAIFPAYLETIRQAESTINCLTYVYWRGDIAREVARALADRRATASTSTCCSTPSARRRWSATCSTTCATRASPSRASARPGPTRCGG